MKTSILSFFVAELLVTLTLLYMCYYPKSQVLNTLVKCRVFSWFDFSDHYYYYFIIITHELLEKVKIHSYWWMKVANAVYELGVQSCLVCLLACLGIGQSCFFVVWTLCVTLFAFFRHVLCWKCNSVVHIYFIFACSKKKLCYA